MKKYKIKKPIINFFREDESVYGARLEGELPERKRSFKLIDMFCGAGGMTLVLLNPSGIISNQFGQMISIKIA